MGIVGPIVAALIVLLAPVLIVAAITGRLRRTRWVWANRRTLIRTAKYLGTCRKAVPWYLKAVVVLALVIKCLPVDFGIDETLLAAVGAVLWWRHRPLLMACYRAAQLDVTHAT